MSAKDRVYKLSEAEKLLQSAGKLHRDACRVMASACRDEQAAVSADRSYPPRWLVTLEGLAIQESAKQPGAELLRRIRREMATNDRNTKFRAALDIWEPAVETSCVGPEEYTDTAKEQRYQEFRQLQYLSMVGRAERQEFIDRFNKEFPELVIAEDTRRRQMSERDRRSQ